MPATQTLRVKVGDLKGRMNLTGKGHSPCTVSIDYPAPLGEDQGFTSLELFLVSLASCSSHTIKYLLEKTGSRVNQMDTVATGHRRMDSHPTVLTTIELEYHFSGDGLTRDSVEGAIRTAEESMCPVWAMLRPTVEIAWSFRLE